MRIEGGSLDLQLEKLLSSVANKEPLVKEDAFRVESQAEGGSERAAHHLMHSKSEFVRLRRRRRSRRRSILRSIFSPSSSSDSPSSSSPP